MAIFSVMYVLVATDFNIIIHVFIYERAYVHMHVHVSFIATLFEQRKGRGSLRVERHLTSPAPIRKASYSDRETKLQRWGGMRWDGME